MNRRYLRFVIPITLPLSFFAVPMPESASLHPRTPLMPPTVSTLLRFICSFIKSFAFIELANLMSLPQAPLPLPPFRDFFVLLPQAPFRDFAMADCVVLRRSTSSFFKPLALGGKAEFLFQRPLMLHEVGASGRQRRLKDV